MEVITCTSVDDWENNLFYSIRVTVHVYNHESVKAFVYMYAKYWFSELKANIKICKFSPIWINIIFNASCSHTLMWQYTIVKQSAKKNNVALMNHAINAFKSKAGGITRASLFKIKRLNTNKWYFVSLHNSILIKEMDKYRWTDKRWTSKYLEWSKMY